MKKNDQDIVLRLLASITQARAIDRAALLSEAADEIKKLRRIINKLKKDK